MKKLLVMAMFLVLAVALAACSDKNEPAKGDSPEGDTQAQVAVIEKFIDITYFDEGTYEDFKALYADPENVNTKEEFDEFRKNNDPKQTFPIDSDKPEDIKKHLVVKEIDENNAEVYWVKDLKDEKKEEATSVWAVTKVDGEWKVN
ncbi:hypothetical protein DV702_16650 [Sporosarcina sp. PTS2304]|uniref:hypothetical protein n=1 Tax=Sporosarcina sp. PTS2304 TaxID=2283194 RepID=UPI000E0D59A8|nr:hypothetical protein [Sporosarcina sp. PTS2304]AXI01207.1 hypothetical protein DV702_16650 [Sporosarcina sp. PTS2304]